MPNFLLLTDYNENPVVFVINESRVKLYGGNYQPATTNPVVGSKYECVGTVISLDNNSHHPIRVRWDNGNHNDYRQRELIVVDVVKEPPDIKKLGPNAAFRLKTGRRHKPTAGFYKWSEKTLKDDF